MCRMVGMAAAGTSSLIMEGGAAESAAPLPSWQHLVGAKNSLRVQAEAGNAPPDEEPGHDDSWGIGWFDTAGQVSLIRQTGSAADSAYYVFAAEAAARPSAGAAPGSVIIGHLRKASCGGVTSENAHPIRVDYVSDGNSGGGGRETLLVAHNGTLHKPLLSTLRDDLQAAGRDEARADSDTVVLAGWLAAQVAQSARPEKLFAALTAALRELLDRARRAAPESNDLTRLYSGINLLIGHRTGLFALRQFSLWPDYYTLFARPLRAEESASGGWVVASERTDDSAGWAALAPGLLTFFPAGETGGAAVQTAPIDVTV